MEIYLSVLLLLCFIFFIIGAVCMLLLQYYVYLKLAIIPVESVEQKLANAKYSLPVNLNAAARHLLGRNGSKEVAATNSNWCDENVDTTPLMSINFIMQFLFHELKNSNAVRKWFYRKLSLELDELLTKTTTGKIIDKLTIKDLDLGDQFPQIKSLKVHSIELDEMGGRIENLDILLDMQYKGNFCTTIDACMVLGKKGSLTLKIKQLSGLARLQFTRIPYTHWSLSFLGDPELDLDIESKYQGRQMQANITSLISNQIRKAIRRKHTLPNYKLRYKPFFHQYHLNDEEMTDVEIQPNGVLMVKVSEISRLMCPDHLTDIYCTLTIASVAFVEAHQQDDRHVRVSLDVKIHKAKNQQIGLVFKQLSPDVVEIEAVLPSTPAYKANLKAGDTLVAIEGHRIATIQQVAKIIRILQTPVFTLRIDRVIPGIICNDAILEDLDIYEEFEDAQSTIAKSETSSKQNLVINTVVAEKDNISESSQHATPTNSPRRSKLIAKALKKTISYDYADSIRDKSSRLKAKTFGKLTSTPKHTIKEVVSKQSPAHISPNINDIEHYYQHSTVDCSYQRLIYMEDLSHFKLESHCRYLNVCVYGKSTSENQLIGFVNVCLTPVLSECCETSLSQCIRNYKLSPPIRQDLKNHCLSMQVGFDSNLCFGDILLAFSWEGNPNLATNSTTDISTPSRHFGKLKTRSAVAMERMPEDSGYSDTVSLKSANEASLSQARVHHFVRTHFQRSTQCGFCGKKIWLKDALQCRECSMCCHKKCINKCQSATVCGPVDYLANLPQLSALEKTPEFVVTEVSEELSVVDNDDKDTLMSIPLDIIDSDEMGSTKVSSLDVQSSGSSFSDLLAQGIKRVNSASNLDIPGLMNSLATSGSTTTANIITKSLTSTPQHSPSSRKPSISSANSNVFELVTQLLENLVIIEGEPFDEEIEKLTQPIIQMMPKDADLMSLAKNAAIQYLYSNLAGKDRVEEINKLLTKLNLVMDHVSCQSSQMENNSKRPITMKLSTEVLNTTANNTEDPFEQRMLALNVIMLYLCTGLQNAQGSLSTPQ